MEIKCNDCCVFRPVNACKSLKHTTAYFQLTLIVTINRRVRGRTQWVANKGALWRVILMEELRLPTNLSGQSKVQILEGAENRHKLIITKFQLLII